MPKGRIVSYADFLASKRLVVASHGPHVDPGAVNPILFPFQRDLVRWAVRKGRAALFADTGLGKTFMQVEWARLIGQRTLIIAPLSVARQTAREAAKLGVAVRYTRGELLGSPTACSTPCGSACPRSATCPRGRLQRPRSARNRRSSMRSSGSTPYYKATRPDGLDFRTGTIDYGAALLSGEAVRHPAAKRVRDDASTYLSVSVSEADCTGMSWPCRLFRVEPVGRVSKASDLPSKRCASALRVVEELPAWRALGPNGEQVARFIESCRSVTREQAEGMARAWDAAWDAARAAARDAAWDAARALIVRDLITPEQFDLLTGPWRSVMGATWEAAS
jgi:hypothetical protein